MTGRAVTRPESPGTSIETRDDRYPVCTDYLTVTGPMCSLERLGETPHAALAALAYGAAGGAWGAPAARRGGLMGYTASMRWEHGGVLAAWGGQGDTWMLTVPGAGCALVEDWRRLADALRVTGARITRWDGAVDDHAGRHSVADAVDAWEAGEFETGGRPPTMTQMGNWRCEDGRGRTVYVGCRASGKLIRVYEKGKHLGEVENPWVRWEVEWHAKHCVIPWATLTTPRPFIAGAAPAMAWASRGCLARIRTSRERARIAVDKLVHHASTAYGRLIDTLMVAGVPGEAVLNMLRRPGTPRRMELDELIRQRCEDGWMPDPMPAWLIYALAVRVADQESERPPPPD